MKKQFNPDYQVTTYQLEHVSTGGRYFHIDANDRNNCMAIIFKTIPQNSRGVQHILEHLALCGCEKYPIRDPFTNLSKRSLNTYMNAWTGADFTAYPFSTQNEMDFRNLMSVYLDAAFRPLLKKTDFMQEGWRYDFDEKGHLQYKGIVLNEMKGQVQSSANYLYYKIQRLLYQHSSYRHISAGLPEEITDLSYEELRRYYDTFYHPSNAKIYSYGDLDFQQHLRYIDQHYFSKYKWLDLQNEIKVLRSGQQESQPQKWGYHVFDGPVDNSAEKCEKQFKMAICLECNDIIKDRFDCYGLNVLSFLLFQQPNGIFYKRLIESGLAPSFINGCGYDYSNKLSNFVVGVQGIEEGQVPAIEKVVAECLQEAANNKFDEQLVEGILHQIEIQNKIPS